MVIEEEELLSSFFHTESCVGQHWAAKPDDDPNVQRTNPWPLARLSREASNRLHFIAPQRGREVQR
jgi:hypothetical protein